MRVSVLLKVGAAALLAALVGGAIGWPGRGGKADEATTAVKRQDLLTKVTIAGTVLPARRTLFTPPYNAYIRKIHVRLGEDVAAGAPIVTLGQTSRGAGEELYPLRAPFSGRVVQVLKTEGEFVEAGKENSAMVRVDDIARLFVYSDLPENDVNRVKPGQEVLIKANAILDRSYKGVIREIALAAKEKKEGWSRSGDRVEFEVHMEVTDKDEKLKPGMSAIVDIITDSRKNVLTLPHEYVERRDGKYWVTLASGGRKEIEVGAQSDELIEVRGGLAENDQVRLVDFFSLPKLN